MYCGGGNDTRYGDAGNDTMYGGAGDDVFYVTEAGDVIYGGAGTDTVYATVGSDLAKFDSVENLTLTSTRPGNINGHDYQHGLKHNSRHKEVVGDPETHHRSRIAGNNNVQRPHAN